jgi:hypothetical protein
MRDDANAKRPTPNERSLDLTDNTVGVAGAVYFLLALKSVAALNNF